MNSKFIVRIMNLIVLSIMLGLPLAWADDSTLNGKSMAPSPEGGHIKVLWSKEYDPEGMDELRASTGMRFSVFPLFPIVKDGLAMVVMASGDEGTHAQYFILKLNDDGSIQWQRALGADSVTAMVAVPDGYVLLQQQCDRQQFKRFDNHGKLVKFRESLDFRKSTVPASERNVKMFARGKIIEYVWTECSKTVCTAWKYEMDAHGLFGTTKVDALFKISLPKASKGTVRTQPQLSVLHRAPQEWIVNVSVGNVMEGDEEVKWGGWLYAIDEHGNTMWSVEYSDPKGGAFVRRLLPTADGYIIIGSTNYTVWRRKMPDKIPATLEGLQSVLNRPAPSVKAEIKRWLLHINNKGQTHKQYLPKDGVSIEFMQHDAFVGLAGCGDTNVCELGEMDEQGQILWKTASPVTLRGWATAPAMIPDSSFIWTLGDGKEKLFAVSRIKIEEHR